MNQAEHASEIVKHVDLTVPNGENKVLMHSCCAPCAGELMEQMVVNGIDLTIFFYNPNLHPLREYNIRKDENIRFAEKMGVGGKIMGQIHRQVQSVTIQRLTHSMAQTLRDSIPNQMKDPYPGKRPKSDFKGAGPVDATVKGIPFDPVEQLGLDGVEAMWVAR